MKYEFSHLPIGDSWISGSVEFEAFASFTKVPWIDTVTRVGIDFSSLKLTYYDTDLLVTGDFKFGEDVTEHLCKVAIAGFGWEKFAKLLQEKVEEYCDAKGLYQDFPEAE